ncbi:MAG TPA: SRPBCC family protein [Nocardioidaceae bacterium]|nr:SRPBCC family protein [Nocardioidaceae bacterium]
MADQTSSSIVIAADAPAIMDVIADFEAYPLWAQGVSSAEVVVPGGPGERAREVYFEIEATPIRDSYTLAYVWHSDHLVTWTLSEGKMLRAIDGSYELNELADGTTEVTYALSVELAVPMIGMLRRKAEKVIIDAALKGLKKRVESL